MIKDDLYWMREAYKRALKAYRLNEVPVGCVIVKDGKLISSGYNQREKSNLSLAHAEILAIKKACKSLDSWRLDDCVMYITLEPCVMCSGAIIQSRIKRVVYAASDYRFGCHKSIINLFDLGFNHKVLISDGLMKEECSKLISDFFKKIREEK